MLFYAVFRSLTRKFVGSDGREYKWSHQIGEGQQWSVSIEDLTS
jgi:hypothetical protein